MIKMMYRQYFTVTRSTLSTKLGHLIAEQNSFVGTLPALPIRVARPYVHYRISPNGLAGFVTKVLFVLRSPQISPGSVNFFITDGTFNNSAAFKAFVMARHRTVFTSPFLYPTWFCVK